MERLGQVVTPALASYAQYVTFLYSCSDYATSYFIPQTVCRARFAIVSFSYALFYSDKQICPSFKC